ncbi:MAG: peptidoglycan-binding domain-containing protein [Alphaproteobacteria bacterium]
MASNAFKGIGGKSLNVAFVAHGNYTAYKFLTSDKSNLSTGQLVSGWTSTGLTGVMDISLLTRGTMFVTGTKIVAETGKVAAETGKILTTVSRVGGAFSKVAGGVMGPVSIGFGIYEMAVSGESLDRFMEENKGLELCTNVDEYLAYLEGVTESINPGEYLSETSIEKYTAYWEQGAPINNEAAWENEFDYIEELAETESYQEFIELNVEKYGTDFIAQSSEELYNQNMIQWKAIEDAGFDAYLDAQTKDWEAADPSKLTPQQLEASPDYNAWFNTSKEAYDSLPSPSTMNQEDLQASFQEARIQHNALKIKQERDKSANQWGGGLGTAAGVFFTAGFALGATTAGSAVTVIGLPVSAVTGVLTTACYIIGGVLMGASYVARGICKNGSDAKAWGKWLKCAVFWNDDYSKEYNQYLNEMNYENGEELYKKEKNISEILQGPEKEKALELLGRILENDQLDTSWGDTEIEKLSLEEAQYIEKLFIEAGIEGVRLQAIHDGTYTINLRNGEDYTEIIGDMTRTQKIKKFMETQSGSVQVADIMRTLAAQEGSIEDDSGFFNWSADAVIIHLDSNLNSFELLTKALKDAGIPYESDEENNEIRILDEEYLYYLENIPENAYAVTQTAVLAENREIEAKSLALTNENTDEILINKEEVTLSEADDLIIEIEEQDLNTSEPLVESSNKEIITTPPSSTLKMADAYDGKLTIDVGAAHNSYTVYEDVIELQQTLLDLGYGDQLAYTRSNGVDGKFGQHTLNALEAYYETEHGKSFDPLEGINLTDMDEMMAAVEEIESNNLALTFTTTPFQRTTSTTAVNTAEYLLKNKNINA